MSLRVKEGTPLLVILHGAANEDVRLPFLSGQSISKDLPVSKLSISDPSLYCDPKLNLSWFAGNEYQPRLVEDLAAIISKVSVHCKAPRIVLLGGSGGGFAAINLAARLSNATAVAMNPQTDIFRYHANHVKAYIDLAWAGDRERFITQDVHNLSSAIKASETKPTIVYLQNSNDTFHAINHLQKFTSEVANVPFYKLQAPWRDGHTPPPKSLISQVLKLVVNDEFEGLKQLGFVYHGTQNDSA